MWKWLISLFKKEEVEVNTKTLDEEKDSVRKTFLTQKDLNEVSRKMREVEFSIDKHLTMREIWNRWHEGIFDELNKLRMANLLDPIVIGPIDERSISDGLRNADFLLNILGQTDSERNRLINITTDEILEITSLDFESIFAYKLMSPKTIREMSELFIERDEWRIKRSTHNKLPTSVAPTRDDDLHYNPLTPLNPMNPATNPWFLPTLLVMDDVASKSTDDHSAPVTETKSSCDSMSYDSSSKSIADSGDSYSGGYGGGSSSHSSSSETSSSGWSSWD